MKHKLALTLLLLSVLALFAGCKAETPEAPETPAPVEIQITAEELCKTLTGHDDDAVLMSGDGIDVPLGLYVYWQIYNASLMEYRIYTYAESDAEMKSLIGTNGYLNWDAPFNDHASLREYIDKQTDDTVRFYAALEAMALENGLLLTEEDRAKLEAERLELVASLGSEAAFDNYIGEMCLSRENFDRISAYPIWLDKLLALSEDADSPLYIGTEELNAHCMFTDHIYLPKIDLNGYEPLPEDEISAQRAKAEELAAQLAAADDAAALFDTLADLNSQDPYRSSYPDGYVYSLGTMNAAYETAALSLQPGEVSGIVEGETGFYIILKKDLIRKLETDPEKKAAMREEILTEMIRERSEKMSMTPGAGISKPEISAMYKAFVDMMNEMGA